MQPTFSGIQQAEILSQMERQGKPVAQAEPPDPWEFFREDLGGIRKQERQEKMKGGRPPTDRIVMLEILVLQYMYKLSDD